MDYVRLLIFSIFLTACNSTVLQRDTSSQRLPSLPTTEQHTDDNDLKIIEEDSLVGQYTLKRGLFRNQEITEGYLVIQEIDVNNYGYYYVTITEGFTPETHTGIFYKKGGKYVQKVIEDSSEAEISQGKRKYKMSIIDNIEVKQEDKLLKIFINSTKKEKLLWKRDNDNKEKSQKMINILQNAKHEYIKYYQEKCNESSDFCGDSAYTKVND